MAHWTHHLPDAGHQMTLFGDKIDKLHAEIEKLRAEVAKLEDEAMAEAQKDWTGDEILDAQHAMLPMPPLRIRRRRR